MSENQNRFYKNRNTYKSKLLSLQSMHENDKSVQSGGSAYSRTSGASKGSGLNSYSGLGNVAALLQPQTALEQIQEATGNYESRLESLADCEQDVTDLSIDPGVAKGAAQGSGRSREIHMLRRPSANTGSSGAAAGPSVAALEKKLQQKLQSGQLGQFESRKGGEAGATGPDKKSILQKPILQIKDLTLNTKGAKPQPTLQELSVQSKKK